MLYARTPQLTDGYITDKIYYIGKGGEIHGDVGILHDGMDREVPCSIVYAKLINGTVYTSSEKATPTVCSMLKIGQHYESNR